MSDRLHSFARLFTALALVLGLLQNASAIAQDASPESSASLLAQLGLPEIEIIVSSDASTMPAEADSGPHLLTVHNETDGFVVSSISMLPSGISSEDYLAALTADELPQWVADAVIVGGLDQDPGTTASVVIDLTPGTWNIGLASADVEIGNPIGVLEVSGDSDPALAEAIPTDVAVGLGEYTFDLPDTIFPGPQIWKLENTHTVPHHLVLFEADRLFTSDEIIGGLEALFMGTPVADGFDLSSAGVPIATSAISQDVSIWIELDLQPGFYVALCFLPDPGGPAPHAFMGMVDSFEVVAS